MKEYKVIGKKGAPKVVEVYFARKIEDQAILSRIEKRLGNESEVRLFIDKDLIGGFKIIDKFSNKVFDASVKSQLEKLKQSITK
ncbi:MAG: hypothetical protein Kow0081_1130 [Candidatus Dojkabacteria bacterium]